ncbi:claudin-4-like [Poecilia reticulata]|uniref:claudin-4-like n=1 Tax=Poecilia reticulata TaxID=8081 RepID=UPI0004A3E6BE|nr:PREDICTED: claudin-4-like [Poecilia reticulata]
MALKTVQMIFVVLGAVGMIGVTICCSLPEWFVGHVSDMEFHRGLWKTCVTYRTSPHVCGTIPNTMISSEIHAWRAMTVISCLLCGLSLLLLIFGSDFTQCVQNQDTKPKMIKAAAVGLILAGLLVIIPVSWVTHIFRNAREGMMVGASIYIGFIAGVMMMLTGVLLCCLIRSGSSSSGGTVSFSSNRV